MRKLKRPQRQGASPLKRRRVLILGAGVSASCGIAVAKAILRHAMLGLAQKNAWKLSQVHKLLKYLYPGFDERLRNYPNIEDFLNLVEMAKRFNTEEYIASTLWSKPKLQKVVDVTLKAVTDYIWSLMENTKDQQAIRDFVRQNLKVGDTIITFNWDLTIERALEEYPGNPGFSYTYSRGGDSKQFALLKPHGSIDWFAKNEVRGLKSEREMGSFDRSLGYYPRFNLAENPTLALVLPVIIPPVAAKEFEWDFIKRTWRFVYRAITDATSLHILGYSMPREDQFARLVLRRAIRNNILKVARGKKRPLKVLVVNPDENAEGTFARLVGRDVEDFYFYQAYFQDYVTGLEEWKYE